MISIAVFRLAINSHKILLHKIEYVTRVKFKTCLILYSTLVHSTNRRTAMNGTVDLYHKTLTDQSTSSSELLFADYDSAGAILFIIVVLLWYSMGVVCMLGMQIKAHNETVEDCARRRAKLLIETLRDQTHTKQILGSTVFVLF